MPRHARQASRDEIVQALSLDLLSFTEGQRSRYNLYAWEGESLEIEARSGLHSVVMFPLLQFNQIAEWAKRHEIKWRRSKNLIWRQL